jgi:uncharacterized protein (DUF488 family)
VSTSESLVTVGHGTLDGAAFTDLLSAAAVESVVDIRRFPGSRRNPEVALEQLASRFAHASIGYRWDARLGGRRTLPPGASPDQWWQVKAFRAYAAHMRTPEFLAGLDELLEGSADARTAIMCSESVWWRCHRRLVADVVALCTDRAVVHLMHDGRQSPHPPSAGARVSGARRLVWDGQP